MRNAEHTSSLAAASSASTCGSVALVCSPGPLIWSRPPAATGTATASPGRSRPCQICRPGRGGP
eukprot:3921374-Alexandrium_andersonii.AAC.1